MVGAWGNGAAAPAVLARDALASSVDKQHEDDDEAVDHLPASGISMIESALLSSTISTTPTILPR